MEYQTMIFDAASWLFSDLDNGMMVIGTMVVIGALVAIGRSFGWCSHTRNIGRRVL